MGSRFIEWRESVIKDNPICKECGKKTTGIDQYKIIIGVDHDNNNLIQGKWYSQHKECDLPRPKWSRQKDS